MNKLIEEILSSNEVETPSGKKISLHSAISRDEGTLLLDLFTKDSTIKKTLEVGCAYGLSSLFIAEGLKNRPDAHHTIVDPFQHAHWEGIGIHNLKKSGFDYFELVEEKSEFALPAILKDGESSYDLVFVDGWHTFDHTLLDCFYAIRLLRVGGYLVVDDVNFPAIRRVIDYLLQYPCLAFESSVFVVARRRSKLLMRRVAECLFGLVPSGIQKKVISKSMRNKLNRGSESMVALKKTSSDDRNWNWYSDEF